MTPRYHFPDDVEEALALIQSGSVSVIAGGTDFYPAQQRRPVRCDLVDITRIQGLKGIRFRDDGWIRIGAATTWTDIARADLPDCFTALREAAFEVGSVQIQNAGTIGGNICNASPAADGIPPLLILDAEIEIASGSGSRRVPLSEFVTDVRRTVLAPDELLTAVHIPPQPERCGTAFCKLGARRYLVISIVMTAALVVLDSEDRIAEARIAVGSCSAVAQRLAALESHLIGQRPDAVVLEDRHLQPLSPISDVRADAGYRMEAALEQVKRAIVRGAAAHG